MTELNASKAREILNSKPHPGLPLIPTPELRALVDGFEAKGFMQAHALAERVLVKALEAIITERDDKDMDVVSLVLEVEEARRQLSEWRKANGDQGDS